ncbi:MAG: polysaccharide biosynthesis protein [Kiritimatiellae bacterium]|nr:polysaccharide biosynthesis protein [Kiritimatiellia bacterium]
MLLDFDLDRFIRERVTRRDTSLMAEDLARHEAELTDRTEKRRVLVIGGAGTIGSSYIRAILRFRVAKLCVVDTSENGLVELVRDLRSTPGLQLPDTFVTYPVSFGDPVFEKILAHHGPFDIVANFAAHKHVRSEKDIFSIEAMVENNVLRAEGLLERLAERPPERFFCVSTDKAANPANVMGATKKLMEDLILAYADRMPVATARFANVAFSNGSLPLAFLERLAKRQPWSCPLNIRRFFVSPREAGEICLIASLLGNPGDILFPKLDESEMLTFDAIAHSLLETLGMQADLCATEEEARDRCRRITWPPRRYPVHFFPSDTSGEKPYEEFYTEGERRVMDRFVNLGVIPMQARRELADVQATLARLRALFGRATATKADVVAALAAYLPTFVHVERGRNLDQRM